MFDSAVDCNSQTIFSALDRATLDSRQRSQDRALFGESGNNGGAVICAPAMAAPTQPQYAQENYSRDELQQAKIDLPLPLLAKTGESVTIL